MALEKQARQIGEHTYEVTQLGAKTGNRVLMKLGKSVAPVFLAAATARSMASIDAATAAAAIRDMSEEDFDWVVAQLAGSTDVVFGDGKSPRLAAIFDLHFAGRYGEELEWLEFAIEVNFAPFFLALKQKAASAIGGSVAAAQRPSS